MSNTSIKATQNQEQATLYTRTTMNEANDTTCISRACIARTDKDNKHLWAAYRSLVSLLKVPADAFDEEFTPETTEKTLPVKYLYSVLPDLKRAVSILEESLTSDNATTNSAKDAFAKFVKRFNGGEVLPYNDIAAKALFHSCKRVKLSSKTGRAEIKSAMKNGLGNVFYLACTGLSIPDPDEGTKA